MYRAHCAVIFAIAQLSCRISSVIVHIRKSSKNFHWKSLQYRYQVGLIRAFYRAHPVICKSGQIPLRIQWISGDIWPDNWGGECPRIVGIRVKLSWPARELTVRRSAGAHCYHVCQHLAAVALAMLVCRVSRPTASAKRCVIISCPLVYGKPNW